MAPDPFLDLVRGGDDAQLCDVATERVVRHFGEEAPAGEVPEPFFTAVAVYTAAGIVQRRGFQVLFESELPGDPTYAATLAAFDRVGCRPAFSAFQRALALFPHFDPHDDPQVRGAWYDTIDEGVRAAIDRDFRSAGGDLTAHLAAFVRSHAERFAELGAA